MLSKILGTIWIILGSLWLVNPLMLKNSLKKKMSRKMRKVVYGFIIIFAFLMIGSVMKAQGVIPKIIGIIGMVLAIKAILLLTSKTSEKIFDWWTGRSLKFFRIGALCILMVGILLMFAQSG